MHTFFFYMQLQLSKAIRINNASMVMFAILLFAIPVNNGVLVPALYLWALVTIISYFYINDYSAKRFSSLLILPALLFAFYLFRAIFFGNLKSEISEFEIRLSLLVVPLVFPYRRSTYHINKNRFLFAFVAGNAFAAIICYASALYNSITFLNGEIAFNSEINQFEDYFFGSNFSFLLHPTYFSVYINISLLILFALRKEFFVNSVKKVGFTLLAFFLVLTLIVINSRVGVLTFILMLLVLSVRSIFFSKRYFLGILIIGLLVSISVFLPLAGKKYYQELLNQQRENPIPIKNSASLFNRIGLKYYLTLNSFNEMLTTKKLPEWNEDWTTMRIYIWKGSFELIKENPLLGVGQSKVRLLLTDFYKRENIQIATINRLNCHNQFIETWLAVGVFGLVILLVTLIAAIKRAWTHRNWLLFGFLAFYILAFLFESMLNRIAGVVSFTIFYCFFLSYFGNKLPNLLKTVKK